MRIETWGSAITSRDQNPQEASDFGGARGALTDEMLSNIINDNERVRAAFTSPDGLTRIAGDEERHVAFTVVMMVTDRRVLFVSGDSTAGDLGADMGSLSYDDIAAVGIEGANPAILALSMANGVRWEFPLPDADPAVVDSVVRHLRWIGEVRARLVACRNDLEMAANEIRDHASSMAWDQAEEVYGEVRETLDQLISAVQWTEPIADEDIAPELTEMERTLERAYARLFIERAESQLELGQQLVENEEYNQARTVLKNAQEFYQLAQDRADAVKRGDAFRFGEQRDLRDDLDRLAWEIEAVAAEPIRQAHEAKIMATSADDPAEAVDRWETAFRRYGNVLTLEWGDGDRYFAGDREEVRGEMEHAADRLIECHRELARDEWNAGVEHEREGEVKAALRTCADAKDHIERAVELASEFREDAVEKIRRRRERMESALYEMRQTATVERTGEPDTETPEQDTPQEGPTGPSAATDLTDIDTHQDITLDMSIEEQAADGGRRGRRALPSGEGDTSEPGDTGDTVAEEDTERERDTDPLVDPEPMDSE